MIRDYKLWIEVNELSGSASWASWPIAKSLNILPYA